jgi:ring-1,2-phenylacetyl-CoA epoxidase subunit PaaE
MNELNDPIPSEIMVRQGSRLHRLRYIADDTILETMRKAAFPAASQCEQGVCGTCVVQLLQGEIILSQNQALSEKDLAEGLRLTCQGRPRGAVVEIELL